MICIYILYRYTYVLDVWQILYFLDMLSCFVQFNLQSLCNLTMAFSANFQQFLLHSFHLDVSENSGTPKSSMLLGFSIINHPFWGTPIFGNIHLFQIPFYMSSFFLPVTLIQKIPEMCLKKMPCICSSSGETPCDTAQLLGASEDWVVFRYFEDEVFKEFPKILSERTKWEGFGHHMA